MKRETHELREQLQREREATAQDTLSAAARTLARSERERDARGRALLAHDQAPLRGHLAAGACSGLELKRAAAYAARAAAHARALRRAHQHAVHDAERAQLDQRRAQTTLADAHQATRAAARQLERLDHERRNQRRTLDEAEIDDLFARKKKL